jgi:cytochrome P450
VTSYLTLGADTTAETLTYLTWQISRPGYQHIQGKLRQEMRDAAIQFDENGLPPLRAIDKLLYLNAVINEALRVYPAIPISEPRVHLDRTKVVSIYGYNIPAGTICSMQPYTENRIPEVFPDPDNFYPERWMIHRQSEQYKAMNRMMWSFSSGGRMCIGLQYFSLLICRLI